MHERKSHRNVVGRLRADGYRRRNERQFRQHLVKNLPFIRFCCSVRSLLNFISAISHHPVKKAALIALLY